MRLVGRPELVDEAWFATGHGRVEHADEIDVAVYHAADILADPHLRATGAIATIADPELGPIVMTGPISRLSATPAAIRFSGGTHGADTDGVLAELGLSAGELGDLRERGVVA